MLFEKDCLKSGLDDKAKRFLQVPLSKPSVKWCSTFFSVAAIVCTLFFRLFVYLFEQLLFSIFTIIYIILHFVFFRDEIKISIYISIMKTKWSICFTWLLYCFFWKWKPLRTQLRQKFQRFQNNIWNSFFLKPKVAAIVINH